MTVSAAELTALPWLAATQFLLYGLGWGVCSLLLREQRVAVAHWAVFMLLAGTGLLMTSMRDETRTWWAYGGANAVLFAAVLALRRGAEVFTGVRRRDREHLVLLVLVGAAYLVLGANEANASWRVLLALGGPALLMIRMCLLVRRPVVAEYGVVVALALATPAVVMAASLGARMVQQALDMGRSLEMHHLDGGNIGLLFGYVVGAGMYNFAFVAMLTLRLLKRVQALSLLDPLTGLLNRRALDSQLQREYARARRGGEEFAVLAIDVDHFKQVNDRYGHQAGDALLTQLAGRLQKAARQTDVVARVGGEEFVVIVPRASLEGAVAAANRQLAAVRKTPFELPSGPLPATVSIGVAVVRATDADAQAVVKRADDALYQAKASGRDRVCVEAGAEGSPIGAAPPAVGPVVVSGPAAAGDVSTRAGVTAI